MKRLITILLIVFSLCSCNGQVPSIGGMQYTVTDQASGEAEITTAVYSGSKIYYGGENSQMMEIALNTDGTKMFAIGYNPKYIYEYSLATAFDLSTASYTGVSFYYQSQDYYGSGLGFNNDGTKMYMVGFGGDKVYQYDLSTPWSLASASYSGINKSVATETGLPYGIEFTPTGDKMFVWTSSGIAVVDGVIQYDLSTTWDVSTATYSGVLNVGSETGNISSARFNSDGTTLYALNFNGPSILKYELTIPYDLSSGSYSNILFSLTQNESQVYSFVFSSNKTKFYITSNSGIGVTDYYLQYNLGN